MRKVRLVQLLCPKRHCVLGSAYQTEDGIANPAASMHLTRMFGLMVDAGAINPWCDICKSKDLHTEDEATIFSTMEEARPNLAALEREQAAARAFWKASKG